MFPRESRELLIMNSWDLFDTLVAGRDIMKPSGDLPEGYHFPIVENVQAVKRDDIIISDYYDHQKAHRILKTVTGLPNKLFVGDHIKVSGEIWPKVCVKHHTGDRPNEIAAALRCGVRTTLTRVASFTTLEQDLFSAGFKGLALTMRETRLTTYDAKYRAFETLQSQGNFPFLFLASLLLHRKMVNERLDCVLMSSRDACLWHRVQEKVRDLHCGKSYKIHYWLSSRLTRYRPSMSVINYTKKLLAGEALIADVCGSGYSLRAFINLLGVDVKLWLIVGWANGNRPLPSGVPYMVGWCGTTAIELANLAQHPMVCDVSDHNPVIPIYINPTGIDWASVPEIQVMHRTFIAATSLMGRYDYSADLEVGENQVRRSLNQCFGRIDEGNCLLRSFAYPFFGDEEDNTRRLLSEWAHQNKQ